MSKEVTVNPKTEIQDSSSLSRTLPYNILAEQMLLGNILVDNEMVTRISEFLDADHFFDPIHKKIYATINMFLEKGIIANPVTLKNSFDKEEALKDRGGSQYLADLASLSTTIINIYDYGRTIYDLALRRQLIHIGQEITNDAFDKEQGLSANQQIEVAEQKLYDIADDYLAHNKGFVSLTKPLDEAIKKAQHAFQNKNKVSGIATDFVDLDDLLGGLQNSDLIIIAGRPSMGKTAVKLNLAFNCYHSLLTNFQNKKDKQQNEKPKSVGFFSLEMSSEQIASRLISMLSGISTSKLRTGHIDEEEFGHVVRASKELQELEFFIDDTPSLSISALRTRARRLKRKHNLGILFVDYLQLLRSSNPNNKDQNRVQEISEITQGLKAIAKELNIPVVAGSQLSRAVEQREDKRPLLADLRESGSIEQDSDIVVFIYREEYYLMRSRPPEGTDKHNKWQQDMDNVKNITELIVAKHRNGPVGNVKLYFDNNLTRFTNFQNRF
ncbi:MAG: replicative DNA helicase [Rickettsiales bacterium]|nr:replicative DNA helicase [Rickettsiales bacterium]